MFLAKRRLTAAALALTMAVAGAPLLAAPASAAGPYDDKTVISEGHLDLLYITIDDGRPVLQVNDDTRPGGHVLRPADDVVLHVRPSVDRREANAFIADGIPGFTNAGDPIYVLPQTNVAGRIFAGFGYESPGAPTTTSVTYELLEVDGPGNFAAWQAGDEAAVPFLSSTVEGSSFTSLANHEHLAWGFTAEGEYRLTIGATVTLPGAAPVAAEPATYTIFVGESLSGDGDPDPVETELTIGGLAGHYHAGQVATLEANQEPATAEDHYHWFTRAPGQSDWTVVPDALAGTYGFVVRAADDGTEVIVRLYDHDHAQIGESAPVTIAVDDHGEPPVEGPVITSTLPATDGSLLVSVDEADRDVQLTDLTLDAAGDRYVATGAVSGIRVTDTRSDDPGWAASGRVRAFTTAAGSTIDGTNLGWVPEVLEHSAGTSVSPGASVAPALSDGAGIGTWSELATAEAGAGRGTAVLGADLRLEAPPTIDPGTYQGLLILTVI